MFMSSTLEAFVFVGKNYSENFLEKKAGNNFTMKQMFDMSEKLIVGQSDPNGVHKDALHRAAKCSMRMSMQPQ